MPGRGVWEYCRRWLECRLLERVYVLVMPGRGGCGGTWSLLECSWSVLVMPGRGGCGTWSFLECSWRAFDIWAWYVGVLGVGWNVLGMWCLGVRGSTRRFLECS